MCGPRDWQGLFPAGTGGLWPVAAGVVGNAVLAGAAGALFSEAESAAQCEACRLAGGLRERFSFRTRRQNRMSPDGDALIPFCESSSLMAR